MHPIQQASEAFVCKRCSHFDDPKWLDIPPPTAVFSHPALHRAAKWVMQQYVQIPHLVTLVRRHCQNPYDVHAQAQVHELIDTLRYRDRQIDMVLTKHISDRKEILNEPHVWQQPTLDLLRPQAYRFSCLQTYNMCIRYWTVRIWLCGLARTVYYMALNSNDDYFGSRLPLTSLSMDISTLNLQDIDAALNLIMCVPFGLGLSDSRSKMASESSIPRDILRSNRALISLRLILCLQISFGSWHHLEQRLSLESPRTPINTIDAESRLEVSQVQKVKKWVLRTLNALQDVWQIRPSLYEEMERKAGIIAGGAYDGDISHWYTP